MIKIKIVKNKEIIFESNCYSKYSSQKIYDWKDLSYAYLENADLHCANLSNADLSYAFLSKADLSCANLSNADLSRADLGCADLRNAALRNADLTYANLSYANLDDTKLDKTEECRKGKILKRKIIGYKKCRDDIIVKLEIPAGAIVFSINNKKCRTNVAKVIDIDNNLSKARSIEDYNFVYEKGKKIKIKDFNLMYNVECASGIHFFKTRKEAEVYV